MKNKRMNERGEMGIGTLVIFIAMVLVAAVAATVLITTADELQMQAYSTGRTAREDISTGLTVVHVYGDRAAPANTTIDLLYIKVKLQAGSDPIDLGQMVIQISDGDTMVSLKYNGTDDSALTDWYDATVLMDPDEHDVFEAKNVLTEGTMVTLKIYAVVDGLNLNTQQEVTCKLIPKHGIPSLVKFTTPSVYADEQIVELLMA